MIDPLHSLAFSVQANPGVYAVLLGSGVSRSAGIRTGWDITLDLVRKLAQMQDEDCGSDPDLWYRERFGQDPDYSKLLDDLAKTPAERQQLLRTYLEPTEADRADGLKIPTAAHKAIAGLVANGYIRVIITTNFDRLMETALEELGVVPTVLSSTDQVHGAMPLIHTRCCVVKVHGDYLDTRIKNTPAELESYSKDLNNLLDRIFDEFGLIVCGWSAEWDTALRATIERAVSRRFTYFWAVRGEPGKPAKDLIEHRQGQMLSITDADNFFVELARLIDALEQCSKPHPLSTEVAVVSLKRYLVDEKNRIKLSDFIEAELSPLLNGIIGAERVSIQSTPPTSSSTQLKTNMHAYEAACESLNALGFTGGYWLENWHQTFWFNALSRLAARQVVFHPPILQTLQKYPATLLFYALGIGVLSKDEPDYQFIGDLFKIKINRANQTEISAVEFLPPCCYFGYQVFISEQLSESGVKEILPINRWLQKALNPLFQKYIHTPSSFDDLFLKFEVLIGLGYLHQERSAGRSIDWAPEGIYILQDSKRIQFLDEINSSISRLSQDSPFVKSEIFGKSVEECFQVLHFFTSWSTRRLFILRSSLSQGLY